MLSRCSWSIPCRWSMTSSLTGIATSGSARWTRSAVLGGQDGSASQNNLSVCLRTEPLRVLLDAVRTNAPMIYQLIIDNALWSYVQPRGGWVSYAEKVRRADAASATQRGRLSDPNQSTPDSVIPATKFEADHRTLAESGPLCDRRVAFIDIKEENARLPRGSELLQPVHSEHGSVWCGIVPAERRRLRCQGFDARGDLAAAKLAFDVLKTKVANAPILRQFDSAREVHIMLFAIAWALPHERDADFAQLLQATVTQHIGLDGSLSHLASPSKNSATVRLDPERICAHVPRDFVGHVLSFDWSAKTEKNGGYGSCSWIIMTAASAHLPSTTVNIAENTGINNGAVTVLDRGLAALIIVGDSQLAILQSMGVMACKKETLQLELVCHKKLNDQLSSVLYLHGLRHYNASADSLATEALESKMERVVLSGDRKTELKELNRVSKILYSRTDSADSGEPRAEMTVMTRRQARRVHFEDEANKDSAGISQNTGWNDKDANLQNSRAEGLQLESPRASLRVRRVEAQAHVEVSEAEPLKRQRLTRRLVVPTTMVDEVLHSSYNSIKGGQQGIVRTSNRVKSEFYWIGLNADISKHETCPDM
ncbi:unnamed protein product [Phytophthora fragariaefolia]|uniref:Unnamed protein product n=1 Tax=Phytophthora fragariaefolia TaxID=1490495 RepID=A0A9W6TNF4_9STRA|nr:unnamed protein product [Phytophthora fragariaefolia]